MVIYIGRLVSYRMTRNAREGIIGTMVNWAIIGNRHKKTEAWDVQL